MDWSGCDLVEVVPGRCSGQPTVAGTRVFPDTVIHEHRAGMSVEEIHEDFPSVSPETIRGLIRFAERQKVQPAA